MPKNYKGYSTRFAPPRMKTERRIQLPRIIPRPLQFQERVLIRHELINVDPWWLVIHRRGIHQPKEGEDPLEARAVPHSLVRGTLPERILYKALVDTLHMIPGKDFDFQSSLQGGRMSLGGIVADFIFPVMMMVIQVQGPTHDVFMRMRKDTEQELVLSEMGYRVYSLWEQTIYDEAALNEWLRRNVVYGNWSAYAYDLEQPWIGNDTLLIQMTRGGVEIGQLLDVYT